MPIQILPSTGDAIAGTIKDLTAGVDKYLNPNRDLQMAMQRAMASNPELIQHMADLEGNAPGTMARLGLGPDISSIVQGVGQSAAAQGEAATRPGAAKQAVAQQGAATSTAELTTSKNALNSDLVKKAGQIMAADPSITFDAALKTLTGETATERATAGRKNQLEAANQPNALKTIQRAAGLPEDISKIDWSTEARKFIDGQLPGSLPAAYFGSPDTAKSFQEAIDAEKQRRQLEASKVVAAMRGDRGVDNFRTQKAFQEYQKAGGVGTLDAWQGYLFDPNKQSRARELIANPKLATTPEDKALLDVAKVTKEQIDIDKLRDVTLVNDKLATQLKRIDEATTDAGRAVSIDALNQLLKQRASLGGIPLTATWENRTWPFSDRIQFKTKDGKLIDPETVSSIIADPYATDIMMKGPQLSERASQALDMITNASVPTEAALANYEAADKSPNKEDSKAVRAELVRRGKLKGGNIVGASPGYKP
jgi:hypothetical protein